MNWRKFLVSIGDESVFRSSLLKAGPVDPVDLGRQLSRWVKSGKLVQLRRGVYAVAEPYRKAPLHRFVIANRLKIASYVSLQSALEFHGLIPEYVPNVTSVTTGRPETISTALGVYIFRNVKKELFFGYAAVDIGGDMQAFVASPEKALVDLIHLTPGADDPNYIEELRLQNLGALNAALLADYAARADSSKLGRAVRMIERLALESR